VIDVVYLEREHLLKITAPRRDIMKPKQMVRRARQANATR
jgi:hypothetical protein